MSKLTKGQQDLLDAMRAGVRVHLITGRESYYFRADTMRKCSQQMNGLMRQRLVKETEPFSRVFVPVRP